MIRIPHAFNLIYRWTFFTALIVLTAAGRIAAQGPIERPCANTDLSGMWEMILLRPLDAVDRERDFALLQEYQAMRFGADSSFSRIGASRPLPTEQATKLLAASPRESYRLQPSGRLEFLNEQGLPVAAAECSYFIQGNPQIGLSAGTVSILWRNYGKPAIVQAFKKVSE